MALSFLLLRGRTKGPQLSSRHGITDSVYPTSKFQSFLDKLLRIDWIGVFMFMAGGILLLLALLALLSLNLVLKMEDTLIVVLFMMRVTLMITTAAELTNAITSPLSTYRRTNPKRSCLCQLAT